MPDYIIKFDGTDNKFLSNFWICDILFEGHTYKSTEHAFQAAKRLSEVEREIVRNTNTAGDSKRAGRKVTLRNDWEQIKDSIMLQVLRTKFSNKELGDKLLATGDSILIEGNKWCDNGWGVCYCEKCKGIGKNRLGELLMQVRKEIKKEKFELEIVDQMLALSKSIEKYDIKLEQI